MTDLTPEELAGLREQADDYDWLMLIDPETVLRLVAMAERAARYREALARITLARGCETQEAYQYWCDIMVTISGIAHAALAEPEEAQHGDD